MFNQAFVSGGLPLQGTDLAARWDDLYGFLLWLSVFLCVLVIGGMIYFAVKYRHRPGIRTKYITGNHLIEAIWIVVPTVLLMIIFGWGYSVYHDMTQAPADSYEVRVIAKQWLWQFQYDNGQTTVNELYVPINRPVKLIMTSEDVLHSFFVPNFRIKQDVVPKMYTSVWFEARVPGKHQIFCAEYCGTTHSGMLGKVIVLREDQWSAWNRGKKIENIPEATGEMAGVGRTDKVFSPGTSGNESDSVKTSAAAVGSLAGQGKHAFEVKGCVACHSADGSQKVGPSVKGLYGNKVELADGSRVVADENYIRESIEYPQAKLVKGYGPVMPTFKGLISEMEMNSIIAYIKSLK